MRGYILGDSDCITEFFFPISRVSIFCFFGDFVL